MISLQQKNPSLTSWSPFLTLNLKIKLSFLMKHIFEIGNQYLSGEWNLMIKLMNLTKTLESLKMRANLMIRTRFFFDEEMITNMINELCNQKLYLFIRRMKFDNKIDELDSSTGVFLKKMHSNLITWTVFLRWSKEI